MVLLGLWKGVHPFALYSLPTIFQNFLARYAGSIEFYPPLKKRKHALMCFTNPIYCVYMYIFLFWRHYP